MGQSAECPVPPSPQDLLLMQLGEKKATTLGCWPVTVFLHTLKNGTERNHGTPPGGCSQSWLLFC